MAAAEPLSEVSAMSRRLLPALLAAALLASATVVAWPEWEIPAEEIALKRGGDDDGARLALKRGGDDEGARRV